MKLFAFIMLLTVMATSSLPCIDVSCSLDGKMKKEVEEEHDQEQEHKNSDNCTPFCTCSSCPASAFFSPFSKVQGSIIVFSSTKYSLYDITVHSEVFTSIWQPPKLS